jgi:hypothetical protein
MIYPTEEAAFRRAETVRLQGKWWPGVIRHRDGTFELTYDPLDDAAMAVDGLLGNGAGNRLGVIRYGQPVKPLGPRASYPSQVFTTPRREKP